MYFSQRVISALTPSIHLSILKIEGEKLLILSGCLVEGDLATLECESLPIGRGSDLSYYKKCLQKISKGHILSIIPASKSFVSKLDVAGESKNKSSSTFSTEDFLPFHSQEMIHKLLLCPYEDKSSYQVLCALTRQDMENHLGEFKNLGIEPDSTTIESIGLSGLNLVFNEDSLVSWIHVQEEETVCILSLGVTPISSISILTGKKHFNAALDKDEIIGEWTNDVGKIISGWILTSPESILGSLYLLCDQKSLQLERGLETLCLIKKIECLDWNRIKNINITNDSQIELASFSSLIGLFLLVNSPLGAACQNFQEVKIPYLELLGIDLSTKKFLKAFSTYILSVVSMFFLVFGVDSLLKRVFETELVHSYNQLHQENESIGSFQELSRNLLKTQSGGYWGENDAFFNFVQVMCRESVNQTILTKAIFSSNREGNEWELTFDQAADTSELEFYISSLKMAGISQDSIKIFVEKGESE
jgi:hypothetical protein